MLQHSRFRGHGYGVTGSRGNGVTGSYAVTGSRQRGNGVTGNAPATAPSQSAPTRTARYGSSASVEQKISPLTCSGHYLAELREGMLHAWAEQGRDQQMQVEQCQVVLTVPASFDEVARNLTLEAAREAARGSPLISLAEVPIALPSRGSSLFAQTISTKLQRDRLESVILEGFFPLTAIDELPEEGGGAGLTEFGLPSFLYLPDAVTASRLASGESSWIVGQLTRNQEGNSPGQVAQSAKSWEPR